MAQGNSMKIQGARGGVRRPCHLWKVPWERPQGTSKIRLALSEFDINFQDAGGNDTALNLACLQGDDVESGQSVEGVVRLLISRRGVEVNLRDEAGDDAFHHSISHPESGIALLLLTHFPTLEIKTLTLMGACYWGQQRLIDYIHTARPEEWAQLIHGTDPMEREAILHALIEDGSNLHAREIEEGMTTFLYAIQHRGNAQTLITHILKPLLAYDPSAFDQRDHHGRTALMLELRDYSPDETLSNFLISLNPVPEEYLNLRDAEGLIRPPPILPLTYTH
ncbi:hypothetical protein FA13DRAFT_1792940 [Coprinellus micaceus]|uniref:Ankyrin n=1 Tax=Coprinellus micaceus TaxID=71717 RepID=A0A4Y7T6M4_COPMI|nr:hypothetical protein FA13DRAFT_1792940 [Coprinellus micaceus]